MAAVPDLISEQPTAATRSHTVTGASLLMFVAIAVATSVGMRLVARDAA